MARIDVSSMVQPQAPVRDSKAAPDSSGPKTDFAQMLKEKDQSVREEGKEPAPQKDVKDSHKKEPEPEHDKTKGDGQVPPEVMLELQKALNQFLEHHVQTTEKHTPAQTQALAKAGEKLVGAVLKEGPVLQKAMEGADPPEKGKGKPQPVLLSGRNLEKSAAKAEPKTEPKTQTEATAQTKAETAASPLGKAPAMVLAGAETQKHTKSPQPEEHPVIKTLAQAPRSAHPLEKEVFSGKNESDPKDGRPHAGQPAQGPSYAETAGNTGNHALFRQMPVRQTPQTVTVRTAPETFGADLGKAIAPKLSGNSGTLSIELEPAALGKLTLKVMYEGDRATVSIMSSNPKTLELLSRSAGEIAQILEQKTGQQTVVYTPQQPEQNMDGRQGGQNGDDRRQDRNQEDDRRQGQPDSFAQQLRLGLV